MISPCEKPGKYQIRSSAWFCRRHRTASRSTGWFPCLFAALESSNTTQNFSLSQLTQQPFHLVQLSHHLYHHHLCQNIGSCQHEQADHHQIPARHLILSFSDSHTLYCPRPRKEILDARPASQWVNLLCLTSHYRNPSVALHSIKQVARLACY